MKWLSLFSGIGGFDLALERAGHTVVGACEIDEYARQIFKKRFPYVPLHGDATKIKAEDLPDFDGIAAGFPCQTFSIAGKRLGFEESRGTLFFEIARIAKQKRPRYLLLENVKGLLSHDSGRTFAEILATLDELGYDAEWQVLNSKYYVPQNRERIFIIGYLRNQPRPKIFPFGEEQGLSDESGHREQKGRERIRSEVSTIDSRYGALRNSGETYIVADRSRSYAGTGRNLESPKNISNSLTSVQKDNLVIEPQAKHYQTTKHNGSRIYDIEHIAPTLASSEGTGNRIKIEEPNLNVIKDSDQDTYRLYGTDGISRSLRASPGGFGKMTGLYDVTPVMAPDIKKKSQNGRTFKEDGDPSFALTAQDKHGILTNNKIRRLTPLECERLQGFPDGWTSGISDTQRYKCLGNAVTVPVVYDIVKKLL